MFLHTKRNKYTPSSEIPRVLHVQNQKGQVLKYFSHAVALRIRTELILEVLGEMSLMD